MLRRGGHGRRGHLSGLSRGLGVAACPRSSAGRQLFAWALPSLRSGRGLTLKGVLVLPHEVVYMKHGLPCNVFFFGQFALGI